MKQVIVIHGGDAFLSRQKFHRALKTWPVSLDTYMPGKKGWKAAMQKDLGRTYQVLVPQMPNKDNADYEEWKIWFERMMPFITSNGILVGHSLGGMFLAKYLSQKKFHKKITALFLVAAPHNQTPDVGSFRLPSSLKKVSDQASRIVLMYSRDDQIVRVSEMKKYKRALPHAEEKVFKNRGHFNHSTFPELVRMIKKL